MKTDVTLQNENKILIINAKYYAKSMQQYFEAKTIHSANLYQIFAYVKNLSFESNKKVSGMLLYAKTNEQITPNQQYQRSGNVIYAYTLDLSKPFSEIKKQLNSFVDMSFE